MLTFLGLKDLNPLQQALICAGLTAIVALICILFQVHNMTAWDFLIAPFILFAIINPILGIFIASHHWKYIAWSVLSFIGLALLTLEAGRLISTYRYGESRELIMITILIFFFYFMVYLLSFVFRGVLGFLEELDK